MCLKTIQLFNPFIVHPEAFVNRLSHISYHFLDLLLLDHLGSVLKHYCRSNLLVKPGNTRFVLLVIDRFCEAWFSGAFCVGDPIGMTFEGY